MATGYESEYVARRASSSIWAHRPSSLHPCLPYGRNACENITAAVQLCRAFDFVERICKIRPDLLLSSGKIHTLSMSSGAL